MSAIDPNLGPNPPIDPNLQNSGDPQLGNAPNAQFFAQSSISPSSESLILRNTTQLPPGKISMFEYFDNVRSPQRELYNTARQISFLNPAVKLAYHRGTLSHFNSLFGDYQQLLSEYNSQKPGFNDVEAQSKQFTDQTIPDFQGQQTTFNTDTQGFVDSSPWDAYNAAVNQYYTDLANGVPYDQAAAAYNLAANSYNSAVNAYNAAVATYNTAVANYNGDLQSLLDAIAAANDTINQLNQERAANQEPLLDPIVYSADSLPTFPTIPTVPVLDPQNQPATGPSVVPSPPVDPLAPSTVDVGSTAPGTITGITFPEYLQEWIPIVSSVIAGYRNIEKSMNSDDFDMRALMILLVQRGKLNTQTFPGFIREVGATFTSTSGAGTLAQLSLGLGNSHLEKALSSMLLASVFRSFAINQQFSQGLAKTTLGLLTQLATSETLLSIFSATSRLLEAGINFNPDNLDASVSAGLSSSNAILNLITSGELKDLLSTTFANIQAQGNMTPSQLSIISDAAAFSLAQLSLAVLGQATQNQPNTQIEGFFSLLAGIQPPLQNTSAFNLFQNTFNTQETFQQIASIIPTLPPETSTSIQNSLQQLVIGSLVNNGIPEARATILASQIVATALDTASRGGNVPAALKPLLGSAGVSSGNLETATSLMSDLILQGLIVAQVGKNAAKTFDLQNQEEALVAASDSVKKQLLSHLTFSEEIQKSIQKHDEIIQGLANRLSQTQNTEIVNRTIESYQSFMKETLKPNAFLDELIDPSKTFIGVMYSGMRKGYVRGSIDIAA